MTLQEYLYAMEFARIIYQETAKAATRAWELYDAALEARASRDEIVELGILAGKHDNARGAAWRNWQQASGEYLKRLAMVN